MFRLAQKNRNFLIITLLLLLINNISIAQTQNITDEQGRKQGFWSKNYDNGKRRFEGNFVDNQPTGSFTYWHENGNLKAEMEYFSADRCHVFLYNEGGTNIAEGYYFRQQKDSIWRYFSEETGNRVSEESYLRGVANGLWVIFYDDGKTPSEIQRYSSGTKNGEQTTYFDNGQLKEQWTCRNGSIEGEVLYYHPNGKVRGTGRYENDLPVGTWTYFDEEGKMTVRDYYEAGKVVRTEEGE